MPRAGAEVEHRRPASVVARHDAAEQRGVAGRAQDPGEDDDAHARCTLPRLQPRAIAARVASAHGRDLSAAALRALFDGVTDHTVGVEEELMLLDPETLDLLPAAARVHAELGERVSLRTELPAAQVETASPVCDSIDEAARALADARRELAAGVAGWARLAGAGTHPFAAPEGAAARRPEVRRR